ncbi:hypothetical protein ACA910_006021 [Epithemia clementina (nom. ined.)]
MPARGALVVENGSRKRFIFISSELRNNDLMQNNKEFSHFHKPPVIVVAKLISVQCCSFSRGFISGIGNLMVVQLWIFKLGILYPVISDFAVGNYVDSFFSYTGTDSQPHTKDSFC